MPKFFCDNCGREVSSGDSACPGCGRPFNDVLCPQCGFSGKVRAFIKGCPQCGFLAPAVKIPPAPSRGIPAPALPGGSSRRPKPARKLRIWLFLSATLGLGLALAVFAYLLIKN